MSVGLRLGEGRRPVHYFPSRAPRASIGAVDTMGGQIRRPRGRRVALVEVPCPICGVLPGEHEPDAGVVDGHHVLCGFASGILPEALVHEIMRYLDDPDALVALAVELRAAGDAWTIALADVGEDGS
jgi:hypothetical protein